jgi:hypothetical protein
MGGCSLSDAVTQARTPGTPLNGLRTVKCGQNTTTTNLTLSSINFHKVEGPKLN